MKTLTLTLLLLALLLFIGCGKDITPIEPTPIPSVTPVPSPEPSTVPEPEIFTGYIKPPAGGMAPTAPFKLAEHYAHPLRFSWVNLGFDIPVRNQGNCGSCWAHGTAEALEFALQIYLGKTEQLSTQELVSCDHSVYGCQGGDFAADYVLKNGLTSEALYPYTASNSKCKSGIKPVGFAVSAINVGANERSAPTTEQLKDALMQFGPLSVTVAAGRGWSGFKGEVMSPCTNKSINHIVLIYGWTEKGWIMRNSWGKSFGRNGDAIMPYGCDRIGNEAATFLVKPLAQYKK